MTTPREALTQRLDSLSVDELTDLFDESQINERLKQARAQDTNIKADWDEYRKAVSMRKLLRNWITRATRVEPNSPDLKRAMATVIG